MRSVASLMIAAGILLTAAAAHAAGEAYDIRLQRPFKAGQTFALSATNTMRSAEKVELPGGGNNSTSVFRRVILDADVQIDGVDDKGVETQATLTIRKLSMQTAEADQANQPTFPTVLLEPGTQVLVLMGGGGSNFALKKAGILSDQALLALQQGFKRISITDALYGTTEQKKIGDSWPINKQALVGDRTSPQYVDPALVGGTVLLKDVRPLLGVPCLQVEGSMTTKDFQVQGVAAKDASMITRFTANLPTNSQKQVLAWSVRSTTHFVTEQKPLGQGIVRHTVDSEIIHEATTSPK